MNNKLIVIWALLLAIANLAAFEPHFATDPAISPDGNQVCFVYAGDLWLVPFSGGTARRITSTEAGEYGPCWSPDGNTIAFNSNREGQTWVYVIPAAGGDARPVIKESMSVCDWYADSKNLLCSRNTPSWGSSLFKLSLDGSRPLLISEIGDYFSTLSPDNSRIIFNRYGDAYREAYTGSTNGELWEFDIATKVYKRLTDTNFTERYPRYATNSNCIFFCASDGNVFQIFRVENGDFSRRFQVTRFDTWSARDISIARQNDRLVFERFDNLWVSDPTVLGNSVHKLEISIAEDSWIDFTREDNPTDTFDSFAVSGDDLLLAFSYKYDLFVMPRKGGEVKQLTKTQSGIENIGFLSDNRTIVFSRYTDGIKTLYTTTVDSVIVIEPVDWYGAGINRVDNFYKTLSNKWVIEYSDSTGGGKIAVADSLMSIFKPVVTDKVVVSDFEISPDGSMAIYATNRDELSIRELYLYDFASNTHRKIMNDDSWIYGKVWTSDQKSILMTRSNGIQRLDLVPRDEFELDVDNWKEIFTAKDSKVVASPDSVATGKKDKKNSKDNSSDVSKKSKARLRFDQIDWMQIEKRFSTIISGANQTYAVQAIDDTTFYYIVAPYDKDKKTTLNKANIFGKSISEIASLPGLDALQFIADKHMYYKEGSKLRDLNLKTKAKTDVSNKFKYEYNVLTLNEKVFEQVWGVFGRNFYDPKMHGRDWNEMYRRYKPYIQYARSVGVLSVVIEEMIGELNASHTGYYPRPERSYPDRQTAYLGLEFEYRTPLANGLIIKRIYPGSRLYNYYGIRDGDVLKAINGIDLKPNIALDSLLEDQTGKKLNLTIVQKSKTIQAVVNGLSWSENRSLQQQNKVDRRRQQVDELSSNRFGYVYIPSMGTEAYGKFVSDFVRDNMDKEALVLDIRGNGGGRIHNEILTFLSKKPNAYSTDRTYGAVKNQTPGRTWTKPIVLLIDENSFSDAEIFPQLFKEAKLGTVIGMPTSGSVIGTWEVDLMDGSSMRMPGSGWYRLDGTNMEGNGAQPDIRVEMTPNELAAENDIQLKKAIEVLMEKLK